VAGICIAPVVGGATAAAIKNMHDSQVAATVDSDRQRDLGATATAQTKNPNVGTYGEFSQGVAEAIKQRTGLLSVEFKDGTLLLGTAWFIRPPEYLDDGAIYLATAAHALTNDGKRKVEDIAQVGFGRPGYDLQAYSFMSGEFTAAVPANYDGSRIGDDKGIVRLPPSKPLSTVWQPYELTYDATPALHPGQELLVTGFPREFQHDGIDGSHCNTTPARFEGYNKDGSIRMQCLTDLGSSGSSVIAFDGGGVYPVGIAVSIETDNEYQSSASGLQGLEVLFQDAQKRFMI